MKDLCLVIGSAGSGRSEVAADLAKFAWPAGDSIRVITHGATAGEAHWSWDGTHAALPAPGDERAAILVSDGRRSQVDQLEALIAATPVAGWRITRIICTVDLPLLHQQAALTDWYMACLHFSDAAVLVGRAAVPNAWLSSFLERIRTESMPCLVVQLPKTGGLPNPAELIEGEPRRMSLVLDDLDAVDEMEFDEDNLPEEPFDLVRKTDPYFERDMHGRRVLGLPDITQVLREAGR
ncbi:MAG: hypothetical protein ACO23N_05215 [Opitutales bacterium]|jgi:hypothetical protein